MSTYMGVDGLLSRLRFKYCPMCRADLQAGVIRERRVSCPDCGWVHYPGNAVGVNVVVTTPEGVVAILPPGEPSDTPAALPGGHVEYGESPEEGAVREALEETGLQVELVRCLGWHFEPSAEYPGPMVSFMFEARAVSGTLQGSEEGPARVYPVNQIPRISPRRKGSIRAMQAYLAARGETGVG